MHRILLVLLAFAALTSAGDRSGDIALSHAMRDYHAILRGGGHVGIESVRDRCIANLPKATPKYHKSVLYQLDLGFGKKYGDRDIHFHKCLAQAIAAGGSKGIAKLYKRYKASKKREAICIAIIEALGECGDDNALSTLVKMCFDKRPDVAAAAVGMCARYPKVKVDERKATMRKLIDLYKKITHDAAGKDRDDPKMELYLKTKPPFDATLKALSGGEELDSAEAWDTWLRENVTKDWPE